MWVWLVDWSSTYDNDDDYDDVDDDDDGHNDDEDNVSLVSCQSKLAR